MAPNSGIKESWTQTHSYKRFCIQQHQNRFWTRTA